MSSFMPKVEKKLT